MQESAGGVQRGHLNSYVREWSNFLFQKILIRSVAREIRTVSTAIYKTYLTARELLKPIGT
jgi:hypothetical protein